MTWACIRTRTSRFLLGQRLLKKPEYDDAGRRADIHLSIRNHGSDEFVVGELVASACLGAAVQLIRKIRGVVGVEHAGGAVLNCPDNST